MKHSRVILNFFRGNIVNVIVAIYSIFMFLFVVFLLVTPFVYRIDPIMGGMSYTIMAPTCHQLTQRSLCVFYDNDSLKYVGNCLPESSFIYTKDITVTNENMIGYKFPVCSRCLSIYIGMLLGVIPFLFKKDKSQPPPIWLFVLLILPLAVDGTLQFVGLHHSNNMLRIVTGLLSGIAVPIYLLPILIMISDTALKL
ncbi:DUF2085 domain-containing protein [Candidatus Micrarchaeota archaeon]|nr:DUF2085 domain-containing protein [Candidatus Micrarchaeota archaeon]